MQCNNKLCETCTEKMVCCTCGKQLCFVGKKGEQEAVGHYTLGDQVACVDCNGRAVVAKKEKTK